MPEADRKLERDIQRLQIDFEKATPLAEWEYREVDFPVAGIQVTIRHKILGKGRIIFLAVHWRFPAPAQGGTAIPPGGQLYTFLGEDHQFDGYIKVRSTVVGQATVLVGLRRDG
jgi:hypothetical protein